VKVILRDVPCDPEMNERRKMKRKAIYYSSLALITVYFGIFISGATQSNNDANDITAKM
jgi:hypothetical protein